MAITYIDKQTLEQHYSLHPAMELNTKHPCYLMTREAIDGKSVFHWDKEQAYSMYKWYCEGWKNCDIRDEFGEKIYDHDFKDWIAKSFYMKTKNKISDVTIEEMFKAAEMEKEMLKDSIAAN